MKTCGICGNEKSLEFFAMRNKYKGTRQSHCRECQKIYRRQHYLDNKDKYIHKAKVWNDKTKVAQFLWLFSYLSSHPCVDCGEKDIRVLEFDHVDPITKITEISALVRTRKSVEVIQKEIDKCVVRCANCHRIKTKSSYDGSAYTQAYQLYLEGNIIKT